MAQQTRFRAGSASGVIALAALVVLILPRSVQRSATYAEPVLVGIAGLAGLAVLIVVDIALNKIAKLTPDTASHTIASRYVAPAAGVVVAAVKFIAYVLLIVLAGGTLALVVNAVTPLEFDGRIIIIPVTIILAVPVMLRWRINWRFTIGATALALTVLTALLVTALIQEATGSISLSTLVTNRVERGGEVSVRHPVLQTFVVMCCPAALMWLCAERVTPGARNKRVPSSFLRATFAIATIYIVLTFYVAAQFGIATWPVGMPTLVMAAAVWGPVGQAIAAGAFALLAVACALAVYDRLPRLLRSLAIDGMLARSLASTEAVIPRRVVVAVAAVLAAFLGNFLTTTYAGVAAFVFVSFIGFGLTALGIFVRGRRVLQESERKDERRAGYESVWTFALLSLATVALLVMIMILQPVWTGLSLVALLVPTALILLTRRRRGKMSARLAPQDLSEGRALPVRIHAVVVVSTLDLPALRAVTYARGLRAASLTAITVDFDPAATERLRKDWQEADLPVSLTVLGRPAGPTRKPLTEYVREILRRHDRDVVMVILPRVVLQNAWQRNFQGRTTPRIFSDLAGEARVMFVQVPYLLEDGGE
ncbi:Amino acid transporter [Actinobaculum suis]|nr:hypothetical protein ACU19_07550 [Actinobaculum suis]OCA93965.1 hypothetical protein ACU20_07135 [Actinobaculum suis]OCA94531.1 hypothetical protein ACU21_06520 [Actinobaculum suis]SDE28039.1 Amino acid transporter [Actinobaculum suis]VDG76623.1 amino acid transporter [Actinobaculum suis]